MLFRSLLLSALAITLSACNLSGSAQKGPYIAGSSVTVSKLDRQMQPIASRSVSTQILDNQGNYSAYRIQWNGWTQVQISGQYFNEFTATESDNSITLNAITLIDRKFDKANVHLYSHLAAARIQQRVADGQYSFIAWSDTQTEMKQTFGLRSISRNIHHGVEQLSLTEGQGRYRKDNANLLLFTGGFLAAGGDEAMLSALTTDFADDGKFNGVGADAFNAISVKARTDGLLEKLSLNLQNNGASNPPNMDDMPQLPDWVSDVVQPPVDTTAPVITLLGANPDTVTVVNSDVPLPYADPGATVTDDQATPVTYEVSGIVDTSVVGEYTLIYTATDDAGNIAQPVERIVSVIPQPNEAPTANAGTDTTIVVGNSVTLNGSGTDTDGTITNYDWYEGDAVLGHTQDLNYTPTTPGIHTLTLVVTDNDGATGSDTVDINVDDIPQFSRISGRIIQANGVAVASASITVYQNGVVLPIGDGGFGNQAHSDADGRFNVNLTTDQTITLKFEADGFATQVIPAKTPALANGVVNLNVMMIARGANQTVSGATGGVMTGADGASVDVAANSFVDQAGTPVTDNIILTITPVNVASSAGAAAFPGEFAGIEQATGNTTPIMSYGTVEYSFTRESTNEKVQLADGSTATIIIPMYSTGKQEGGNYVAGDTIALWSLNETTGIWHQEGTGTVIASDASPTGLALQATVSHFTWWNCDVTMNPAKATVTVLGSQDGTALIKARTSGNIGSFRPTTVDTLVNVNGTSSPLDTPSNGQTCFWADINYNDGSSGTTDQKCFTPGPGETFDVLLSLSDVPLAITSNVTSASGYINFPVDIIDLSPLTSETAVTYAVTAGSLPTGVSLSATSATQASISGVATVAGSFSATITGTDSEGNTSTRQINYEVSAQALQPPVARQVLYMDISRDIVDRSTTAVGRYLFYYFSGGEISNYSFVTNAALGCNSLPPSNVTMERSSNTSPNLDLHHKMILWVDLINIDWYMPYGYNETFCVKGENAAGSAIIKVKLSRLGDETPSLEWQDTPEVTTNLFTWYEAIAYCSNLVLNGRFDWRIPAYHELGGLISPMTYNHQQNRYWADSSSTNYAWFHDFSVGDGSTAVKTDLLPVRCVRGQTPQ